MYVYHLRVVSSSRVFYMYSLVYSLKVPSGTRTILRIEKVRLCVKRVVPMLTTQNVRVPPTVRCHYGPEGLTGPFVWKNPPAPVYLIEVEGTWWRGYGTRSY